MAKKAYKKHFNNEVHKNQLLKKQVEDLNKDEKSIVKKEKAETKTQIATQKVNVLEVKKQIEDEKEKLKKIEKKKKSNTENTNTVSNKSLTINKEKEVKIKEVKKTAKDENIIKEEKVVQNQEKIEEEKQIIETPTSQEYEFEDIEDEDEIDELASKYLNFVIQSEIYGIEIKRIIQIIKLTEITEIPDTPDYHPGVINLRGQVIPIIDLRVLFGFEKIEFDNRACIIILNLDNKTVGLLVERVHEIKKIDETQIKDFNEFSRSKKDYFKGLTQVDDEIVILLDIEHKLNQVFVP